MCKYRKDIIHREMWSQSTTASQRSVHPECYQCSAKLITVFRGCFCFTDEVLFHFSFHMHPVQRFDCLTPAVMEAAVGKPPQPWGWHICVKWKFILSCTDGPTGCYHTTVITLVSRQKADQVSNSLKHLMAKVSKRVLSDGCLTVK